MQTLFHDFRLETSTFFNERKQALSLSHVIKVKHIIYCVFLSIAHFAYTLVFPSIINGERYLGSSYKWLEPSYIHAFFLSRIKFGEFARRPVTTFFIETLQSFGVSLEVSFLITLYTGLTLAFVLLFQLSKGVGSSNRAAYLSTAIFATSFWVIHAFFAEIYAYDEPWQYVFVFASLIFLQQEKWWFFGISLLFGMIARESTLLLLPGIFFFFMLKGPLFCRENVMRFLKVAWTVPVYGLIVWWLIQDKGLVEKSASYMGDMRFKHLYYSFAELDLGIDTLTSFIMSMALPVTLLLLTHRFVGLGKSKPWVMAFLLNFGINAFITFTLTMGRETRIFAQPVLMLSPFLGMYAIDVAKGIGNPFQNIFQSRNVFVKWLAALSIVSAICFAISLFSYEIYWPTDTKFFAGFQHSVYITFSICAILFVLAEIRTKNTMTTKLDWLPLLILVLPIGLFFGNQSGFRAYGTFEPVKTHIENLNATSERDHFLVVGTSMPNVAENYFDAQEVNALGGDFNFQLPVKQFLYRTKELETSNVFYLELEPAINFPFRFILSQYGRGSTTTINEQNAMIVETDKPSLLEAHTYCYNSDSASFQLSTTDFTDNVEATLSEEYSAAFKMTLGDMQLDSLYSYAAKVDFDCDISSEAAIVVSVDIPNEESAWEHEFLNVFLINPDGWNTAYKAINLPTVTDPDALISFYVWNPKGDELKIRNLEIVMNSMWLPEPKEKRSVLSSRSLE